MIKLIKEKVYIENGRTIVENPGVSEDTAKKNTLAYRILNDHNQSGNDNDLKIKFDAMASHDITYVAIIQTARASGMTHFPLPYVLTNCHNSLCAVGGTINEDDHRFGLSAAKKYGGIYVPAHQAVIHSFMREMYSGCGRMILGSDSHTRYGALGTMAVGEGGPELVKQLLGRTYDVKRPEVIAIHLTGKVKPGIGPHDVALAIIGSVFKNGFVKNKVMEFIGDGIADLPIEFRNGIDVMTTETACLTSIWETDEKVKSYFELHNRPEAYKKLQPEGIACYDGMVEVDLSKIESMIALPFHPSNVYTIHDLNANAYDILKECEETCAKQLSLPDGAMMLTSKIRNGAIYADQGIIAGCAGGTFDNLCEAADILKIPHTESVDFSLSVYPGSQPIMSALMKDGSAQTLIDNGAVIKTAFCGPCFGAGDVPANGALSIRHSTRNFPNREGSKPSEKQIASVALMDARSIAATALNGGRITAATDVDFTPGSHSYEFIDKSYQTKLYNGYGHPDANTELVYGPNITDWPKFSEMEDNLVLQVVSYITDPVTTTDELIPSGETSSYRSNPVKLASYALSRKDPQYVQRAQAIQKLETMRQEGKNPLESAEGLEIKKSIEALGFNTDKLELGSIIYATKPGDGSAREQAASSQRVLGGLANVAQEYATKRYMSNLINWGMIPFLFPELPEFSVGDYLYFPNIRQVIAEGGDKADCYVLSTGKKMTLSIAPLAKEDRDIILAGCLINYYKK